MVEAAHAPFVRVHDLGKRYGTQWAARGVSFDVAKGEIFGIVGPNGAGKTTTIKILAGLLAPDEGGATVGGLDVADPRHKRLLGYLPEESALYEDMTPVQYLRFFARLYEVPRKLADARIEDLLTRLQLDVRNEKRIGDMSKGMKRKVAIARSLVHDPDLIIYDEPASGLDPVVSAYILDLVRELAGQGKTVLFSAHNLYHMERVCDRVLILRQGKTIASGSMADIREASAAKSYVVTLSVPLEGTTPSEGGFSTTVTELKRVEDLEAQAQQAGGRLVDVHTKELSLEEIFLRTAAV